MTEELPHLMGYPWPATQLDKEHMRALRAISKDVRTPVTVLLKDAVDVYLALIPKMIEAQMVAEPSEVQYRIRTWDANLGEFSMQAGVPEYAHGMTGLVGALRILREMGYCCNRNKDDSDPSVLVERVDTSSPSGQ